MKWRDYLSQLAQTFLSAIVGSATAATAGKVTEKLGPTPRAIGESGKRPTSAPTTNDQ